MLGLVETPLADIKAKLQVSSTADIHVQPWAAPLRPVVHLWTDGSVHLTTHPWLTLASYAVVADDETLLSVGRVFHWGLSSYTAELWAILVLGGICYLKSTDHHPYAFTHNSEAICDSAGT